MTKINLFINLAFVGASTLFLIGCGSGGGSSSTQTTASSTSGTSSSSQASQSSSASSEPSYTGKTCTQVSNITNGEQNGTTTSTFESDGKILYQCESDPEYRGLYKIIDKESFIISDMQVDQIFFGTYHDGGDFNVISHLDYATATVTYKVESTKYGNIECIETYESILPLEVTNALNPTGSAKHIDYIFFEGQMGMEEVSENGDPLEEQIGPKLLSTTCPNKINIGQGAKQATIIEKYIITDSDGNIYRLKETHITKINY